MHSACDPDRDPQSARPRDSEVNVRHVLRTFSHRRSAAAPADCAAPVGRATARGASVLTAADELAAVEDEWTALAELRCNPFVSPDWFWSWLRNCASYDLPFVPVLRTDEGRLLGLIPLVSSARMGMRALAFAGAEFGDYFHPAAAAVDEVATARAAAALLAERRQEWSVLVADYVDDGSQWVAALSASETKPMKIVRYHDRVSKLRSAVISGLTWEDYLASRSSNFRSQLGRKQRGLARDHQVVYRSADARSLSTDMETLFDLHARRWAQGRSTIFSAPAKQAFHQDFARAALARGWLRLWLLEVDGAPIAAWYGWRLGDRYLYYQAGFDPVWANHSPGLLLLARTIRAAIEEGAAAYDMLLGDETYKARFAGDERTAQTLVMTRARHPARAIVATDIGLRRVARRLPPGVRRPLRAALAPVLRRWPIDTAP
jgi:CelD/BcsL family acetyltransferase involved in cellulose biosynthesis